MTSCTPGRTMSPSVVPPPTPWRTSSPSAVCRSRSLRSRVQPSTCGRIPPCWVRRSPAPSGDVWPEAWLLDCTVDSPGYWLLEVESAAQSPSAPNWLTECAQWACGMAEGPTCLTYLWAYGAIHQPKWTSFLVLSCCVHSLDSRLAIEFPASTAD